MMLKQEKTKNLHNNHYKNNKLMKKYPDTLTVVANDTLTVNMTAIANKARFTLGYPGVKAACDASHTTAATNCWVVLAGECSGGTSILVNTSDYVAIRGQIGKPITTSNFRQDVNVDAVINTSDYVAVRGKISAFTMNATCP